MTRVVTSIPSGLSTPGQPSTQAPSVQAATARVATAIPVTLSTPGQPAAVVPAVAITAVRSVAAIPSGLSTPGQPVAGLPGTVSAGGVRREDVEVTATLSTPGQA